MVFAMPTKPGAKKAGTGTGCRENTAIGPAGGRAMEQSAVPRRLVAP